jgi:hypothetical protein
LQKQTHKQKVLP